MNLPRFSITHRSFVFAVISLLAVVGLRNFNEMSRREDPAITIRNAVIVTRWAGAPATKMEELVTDPLEKACDELDEMNLITSKSLVGLSIIMLEIEETTDDVDQAWDEIRAKVAAVRLPEGCGRPFVNSDFGDVHAVCVALYQKAPEGGWNEKTERFRYSPRTMELFAERVEDELKLIESLSRVEFWGVQEERIYVEVDSADWAQIAITEQELARTMDARNIVAPGGEVNADRGRFSVRTTGEFEAVAEIGDLVVGRIDGAPVRLQELPVEVRRGYEEPAKTRVRLSTPQTRGAHAILMGCTMKDGRNIVQLGQGIRETIHRLQAGVLPPDLDFEVMNDLPRQVDQKISDFVVSLLQGVAVVLGVALLMMGWRPALIMATAVPLSMVVAFAIVPVFGVELEQFSIASLIIALGMVVDNAIVVSDNTVRLIREGKPKFQAAAEGAQSLVVPILTSTLTTVAAFIPMLTIVGNVGEYIRSLPVVVATTLMCSFFVAMFVTPTMCALLLKAGSGKEPVANAEKRKPFYDRVLFWALDHKLVVLGGAGAAFVGTMFLLPLIGSQFFPGGERDQFFVDVWLPEGSPLSATEEVCARIEEEIFAADEEGLVQNVTAFVGAGGPRLMLTSAPEQNFPYYAYMVVNTTDAKRSKALSARVREGLADLAGARVQVIDFVLGPPLDNPVEFRLSGPDSDVLRETADRIIEEMRKVPGVMEPFSDWGASGYEYEIRVHSDAANLAGVTNADVALTMNALLSGATLTTFREGDHQVPVLLRSKRKNRRDLSDLSGVFVNGTNGKVPLSSVATVVPTWNPALIARRNNVRTVTVACQVAPGELSNTVEARCHPVVQKIVGGLPPDYRLEEGGEKEETIKSQTKIAGAMSLSVLLILLVLVTQYNSFLKPLIILIAVPLAVIGVVLGLFVTGWAMGFMAMLGILSLGGIVINNAIVLIDFVEKRVAEGTPLREAVATAGRIRLRPIVLTSLTTIGGLLPLSLSGGPLWEPMSNGMIAGLLFSTVLTLLVVPTIYVLFAERLRMRTRSGATVLSPEA